MKKNLTDAAETGKQNTRVPNGRDLLHVVDDFCRETTDDYARFAGILDF